MILTTSQIKTQDVSSYQPIDRTFKETYLSSSKLVMIYHERVWHPPTDVYETSEEIVVKCELAGIRPAELIIILENNRLTIRGVRLHRERFPRRIYRLMEINYGNFERIIELHRPIKVNEVTAIYQDGFLEIISPKALEMASEPQMRREIKINLNK